MPAKPEPARLSAESLDKIYQADIANIVKAVKAGRPLTNAQRLALEAHRRGESPEPTDIAGRVTSLSSLSRATGVDRRQLRQWLSLPGNPGKSPSGKYSVQAWQLYAAQRRGGTAADDDLDKEGKRLSNALAAVKLDRLRGELVPRDEAEGDLAGLASMFRAAWDSIPDRLAPLLSTEDQRQAVRRAVDDALTSLASEVRRLGQRLRQPEPVEEQADEA